MKATAARTAAARLADQCKAYVSAGSNIEPAKHLRMACAALADAYGPLTTSSVYRNPAVGFDGDDFLNMVIGFNTCATPQSINDFLQQVHDRAGRPRNSAGFVSRAIDLDLLLYGEQIIETDELRVPREDINRYGFVLGPLAEIAPDLRHPANGHTMAELWDAFDRDEHPLTKLRISPL